MQQHRIRKAVIPAAGFGTRMFPATKAVKKELFPLIDPEGRAKPIILAIVEEALSAGIEEVAIITQVSDRPWFENFFKTLPQADYLQKLMAKHEAYIPYLQNLGQRVTILTQAVQDGFGHAVFCAKDWVDGDSFLLLLGDHVYKSAIDISCARQLLAQYEQTGQSVIGIEATPAQTIAHRGCVTGTWREPNSLLKITKLTEKPEVNYAQQHLHIAGMAVDQLLAVFGMYALTARIFDYLEENIQHNRREFGEFQLTSCLDQLQQAEGMFGYWVQGRSFDTGLPDAYRDALIEFRKSSIQ
ncbi:MAG: NTP transferase domain-containing protein [Cyanothece sp. SIO1E1]|nr:NTP transferase domain-containing protein [Cyanothece sp. SIO1E1]